jgi:AraC-like DNA-binding protein/ligand-binding sensor protein
MNTLDIFFTEDVKKLINSFSYCFNVRITIFSTDMKKKLAVDFYDCKCDYCRHIGITLGLEHRCAALDREMCARSEQGSAPLVYTCHSGLVDAALPIRLNGRGILIGYAMVGQFRTGGAVPEAIQEEWLKRGYDLDILKKAFTGQPYFDKAGAENMLNLFSMLCGFIVSRDYIRLRHLDIADQTLRWIEEHAFGPLTLAEASARIGYSESTISHTVKRRLGMNFKQLCILKKIERFEEILAGDPDLSIEKAAAGIGYNDASYFSRLYKKVRSQKPSEFVKTLRRG